MTKRIAFILGMLLFGFMACGGGGSPRIPFPDARRDTGQDVQDAKNVKPDNGVDVPVKSDAGQDMDAEAQDIHPDKGTDINMPDDGGSGASDVDTNISDADILDTTPGEDVSNNFVCSCDKTDNEHPVCGKDGTTTYPNDECALCGQCASIKDYDKCVGCTGTIKNCNLNDSDTYISKYAPCSECVCSKDESTTGPVCGACTSKNPQADCCKIQGLGSIESAQTYDTLCDFKKANGCPEEPTTVDAFFSMGKCICQSCPPCAGKAEDPYCGVDGKTYPNKCWLYNCPFNGTTKLDCAAPCLDTKKCPSCAGTKCAAVCAEVTENGKKVKKSFYNECAAKCAGATIRYKKHCCLECNSKPVAPVCALDDDGNAVTLDNDCELTCSGYKKLYDGACGSCACGQGDCSCSCKDNGACSCDCSQATGNDLVCGGEYGTTWPSQCWTDCLKIQKIHDGRCTHECETCPGTFNPVCGSDNKTYANECFAKCMGVTKQFDGVCQHCQQVCGTPDNPKDTKNPVCGKDGVTYPTACFPLNCTDVSFDGGSCGG